MSKHIHSLLCLGDSYTIGESVSVFENFPYQAVQMMRRKHIPFHAPEIVAQTGWTSFELADYLINHQFNDSYDFVTLLVGVNNQYRGLDVKDYAEDFEFLLRKAIHYAAGKASHVCVLSIPDWGATPFAHSKNSASIGAAIDEFNKVNEALAFKYGSHYLSITEATRKVPAEPQLLAKDGLHYSAGMYAVWATEIAHWMAALG